MAEVKESSILIQDVETKNIMTKSTLPVGGYSVNPYVGCTHGCKYCYASFMKRFTGHTEPWGTFLDVKYWPAIKNPRKYAGQRVVIGSVTDGYLPQEAQFQNTRKLLEQLRGSEAEILICTKSDLVIRDIDLLKELGKVTVSWSINTLDEDFKNDMDNAVSIKRRLDAMKQVYDAGIRTVCFIAPVFPGITDFEAIFHQVRNQCDLVWLENLNLRGGFKKTSLTIYVKNILTWFRCTTLSTTRGTEATSVVWRIKRNGWRKKAAVPSWTTSCPTDEQSLGTRSLWITFTMRKYAALRTPGSELKKYDLRVL